MCVHMEGKLTQMSCNAAQHCEMGQLVLEVTTVHESLTRSAMSFSTDSNSVRQAPLGSFGEACKYNADTNWIVIS